MSFKSYHEKCSVCGGVKMTIYANKSKITRNNCTCMNEESKAFHLFFSVIRDIIADEQKAKLITTKIVSEIIESHLHYEYPDNIYKNLKYWYNVKDKISKL
jgi:hypothetical protein